MYRIDGIEVGLTPMSRFKLANGDEVSYLVNYLFLLYFYDLGIL